MKLVLDRLRSYWQLTKSIQTGLLVLTGVAGYFSTHTGGTLHLVLGLVGSLYLAIIGSTVVNMWYDRDIDARMYRTCWRPLPTHRVSPTEALVLGLGLSALGIGWALHLSPLFGLVVFAGWFFDVFVYTLWLKRRTAWSILWGGLAGGMPVLAGRTLATGRIDLVGVLLALAVLFWIPTHIVTFALRYDEDYRRAGVPTIPIAYGPRFAYSMIAASAVLAALTMLLAAWAIGATSGIRQMLVVLSVALAFLAFTNAARPTPRRNFLLFKFASLYMMGSMLLLALG